MTDIQILVDAYLKREFNLSLEDLHKISQDKALQEIADFGQLQDKCNHEYDHNGECLKCDEPMSEWVGLTEKEMIELNRNYCYCSRWEAMTAIEAKLKEKNT
jgi:hypothetical protein